MPIAVEELWTLILQIRLFLGVESVQEPSLHDAEGPKSPIAKLLLLTHLCKAMIEHMVEERRSADNDP